MLDRRQPRWFIAGLLTTLAIAIPGTWPTPVWAATPSPHPITHLQPQFLAPMARPTSASAYLAPPKKTAPPAPAKTAPVKPPDAVPNESWTATTHTITSPSGLVTRQIYSQPAFRRSGSTWVPIDPKVAATSGTQLAATAAGGVKPVHFGSDSGQLIQLDLDGGPITLSAANLIVTAPSLSGNQILYENVAADTDLQYRTLPAGIKEELILKSALSPTAHVFHLADPTGQLGNVQQQPDGSWRFSVKIDGLWLELAPAFAYQKPTTGLPVIDRTSAHLSVVKAGNGFDIRIGVDAAWLVGKTFPIVLDPTLNFSAGSNTGVDNYQPSGCGGCKTVTTSGELYAATYTGGSYDLEPGRSFFEFDVSQIPAGSQVNSAVLNLMVGGCITTASVCNSRSYMIELHQMTGSWTSASSWTQLSAITSSTVVVNLNQGPFLNTYFWESLSNIPFSNLVQGWVNAPSSNYGFEVQLQNDTTSYNIGGPFYCLHGTWWCWQSGWSPPSLQITYSTPPAAPPTVAAVAGDQNANVTWTVPNNGDSAITGYTVLTQNAAGQPVGSLVSACATCTSATVGGLSYGLNYRFGVYATNVVGNGPTTWSTYATVPLPMTVTVTAPQTIYARGQLAGYSLAITNPAAIAVAVSGLTDSMAPVLSPGGTSITMDGSPCTSGSSPSCTVSASAITIGAFTLAAGQSHTFLYQAVAIGQDRGCAAMSDAVTETTSGGALNRSAPITVCDTGLGIEKWWSYIGRNVTVNSTAQIDIANGNLVVQETDATTIQARGQLAFSLQRSYNSDDSGLLSVPNSLGYGWVLSLSQTGGTVASAVGLYISSGETVSNPMGITLIDGDGTRHVFQLKAVLATPIDVTSASNGPLGLLVPQALTLPGGYAKICVDSTFSAPPGVHLSLWRYLASSTPCSSLSPSTSLILGYGAVRPDRVRYEFSADGRILDVGDGNGDHIRYVYDGSNRISTVYEPRSCSYPPTATCRTFNFSYPSGQETDVVDPAGRTTKYKFDTATPKHLIEVDNPDGSRESYAYGGCTGASANQLCQVTDLRNNHSNFTYTAITGQPGPAGANAIIDRRGTPTNLTYWRPTQGGEWADYVTSDQGGERRTFLTIDTGGRVGEIREGASSDNYLHQAIYTWDVSGQTCRQPDNAIDNNLCRLQRISLAGSTTPSEDTSYVFNSEGLQIKKHQANPSSTAIDTTSGFHSQYVEASGAVNGFDDSVAGSGTVNSGGPGGRSDASTLYYLSDTTQALDPRGNAAGGGYSPYLTTYKPDNVATISAGAAPSTTVCSAGAATNNTGHVCEVDEPTYDGTHATVKRYAYDAFGEKASYTTPDAMAQSPIGASYVYSYYQDSDLDLSGSVSAGGWLKSETDPAGHFVVFGYDRAGDVARTWDRDSTTASGLALSAFPGTISSPPTGAAGVAPYKEVMYGGYSAPWRYPTWSKDPVGNLTTYTLDSDGNRLTIRSPRGNAAGNSSFDVTQTFDANDNLATNQMPVEAAAGAKTSYAYNAFNSLSRSTDPNGNVVVSTYDTINRPTGAIFTRSAWPSDTTTVPPSCRQSTTSDAPIPAGRILCTTTIAYDSLDNVTGTTDANGQTTAFTYDGLHRKLYQNVPRYDGTFTALPTTYVYDPDGNVTDLCPPREVFEASGQCNPSSQYSQHWTYDKLDRKSTQTTYRSGSPYPTNTTTYVYDADGNLISTTDPRGSAYAVTDTFDLNDRKLTETKPRDASTSNTTSWTYNPSGTLAAETRTGGLITAYSYDADQRPVDTVVGASSTSAASAWPVDTTSGGSNIRTRVVYDPDGNAIQRYEPRAFTTSSAGADIRFMSQTDYDADGRPVKQYVPRYDNASGSAYTDEAVDGSPGNPSTGTQASQCHTGVGSYPSTVGVCVTSIVYDYAGNRIKLWLPTSNGSGNRYVAYTYTDDRLVANNDQPSPTGSGRAVTSYLYDADGNQVKSTDPMGFQNTRSYYSDGLLKQTVNQPDAVTHITSYRYDSNGNKYRVTDPLLNITGWWYFSDNLLQQVQDEAGDTTVYAYDQVGNVTSVYSPSAIAADATNPSRIPTVNVYYYDNLLKISIQPITTTQFREHVYTYDGAGRKTSDLTNLIDQNGYLLVNDGTLGYAYYNDDRLSQRLGRYCCSDLISYQYDPAGHTTLTTDNTNRPYSTPNQVFTYYLDGSLRSSQDTTYSLAALYSYDGAGNRVGRAEPVNGSSGRALTTYTYNDAGKMASMTSVATNLLATTFTYDLDGNLIRENDPNQDVLSLRYNNDSTLYSATLTNTPYTLASWIYSYDGDYRVTSQTFSGLGVQGAAPVQGNANYTYDGAGRINSVALPGQSAQSVSWDHDSNRLTYQGVTDTYNMDDSIATAGSTSFTYFPTGARRTDGSYFYCYDGYDRLSRATAVTDIGCNSPNISYAYEGLDRQRAHSEGSGSTFMEYDGLSSTISTEFLSNSPSGAGTVYALAGSRRTAVGSYASGGVQPSTINYLGDDGMGNISTAVTTGGSMACTAWSDAWGVPMSALSSSNPCNTGSTLDTSFYTGSRRDQITGDYQFGVRTYDPRTGSFLEPDTYLGSRPGSQGSVVSDPLTMNRYVYVNGDPLNLIDPTGHMEIVNDSGGSSASVPYVDNGTAASANNYPNQGSPSAAITPVINAVADDLLRCSRNLSCRPKCPPQCPLPATNDNPDGLGIQNQSPLGTTQCGTNLVSAVTQLTVGESSTVSLVSPGTQLGLGVGSAPGIGFELQIPRLVKLAPQLGVQAVCLPQNTTFAKGKGKGWPGNPPKKDKWGRMAAIIVAIGFLLLYGACSSDWGGCVPPRTCWRYGIASSARDQCDSQPFPIPTPPEPEPAK